MSKNYVNICRICMDETDDLTDLSSTDADFIEFNVKLYFCVPTVNIDNDRFPQKLCRDCVSHLRVAYKFKQMCLNSTCVMNELLKRESDVSERCVETDIDELVTNNEMETDVIIEEINRIKQEVEESDAENVREATSPFAEPFPARENILTSTKFITNKYYCTMCEVEFDDDEYSNHQCVHANDELKCPVCRREFENPGGLRRFFKHYCVSKSDSVRLECRSCSRKFKTTQALASHKRVHTDETRMYKCDVCGLFFSTARRLSWHYKNGVHKDRNTNKLTILDVND